MDQGTALAGHRESHWKTAEIVTNDDSPIADQPQMILAGGDTTHLPATLVGADLANPDFVMPETAHSQPIDVVRYRHASWLKGFTPPP